MELVGPYLVVHGPCLELIQDVVLPERALREILIMLAFIMM